MHLFMFQLYFMYTSELIQIIRKDYTLLNSPCQIICCRILISPRNVLDALSDGGILKFLIG